MISVDFTLVLQIIQFLVILFIGKKLIFDPVSATVNSRKEKISLLLKEAESLKSEVARFKKDYEERLAAVKAEVADYQKKMREDALAVAGDMISKVKGEVDAKIAKARHDIELQVESSKISLSEEAKSIADLISDKMLGTVR
ncbi:MAG: ATP synthase F0 subunit B [Calditerrivibrio sp.]|nr:ATP synthase F0 subunit B [Calditerrivibrio sp.]MCA1932673.1 ATP synthase F0 subunit B [Calditerrivibrio sp.]MCA1980353.1 ATP synthase F0 subunit B [Calditerrivibrio sp.]